MQQVMLLSYILQFSKKIQESKTINLHKIVFNQYKKNLHPLINRNWIVIPLQWICISMQMFKFLMRVVLPKKKNQRQEESY